MKLKYHELLSTFAFNFNLRRYIKVLRPAFVTADNDGGYIAPAGAIAYVTPDFGNGRYELEVGRCRLTVSKPVLQASMVSALEGNTQ